ncbi:hypothetical protein BDV98DRAFT_402908 [Pterulicium gracile]|uniref:Uncharacterized protein n=1 Tax=Pterulicium gracile TaxID=1884261 RepID=A0A5C3Q167_9AGAR|nr:hypothetical protein BDV98DRAFT_402908 [Pterula gracilis]
MPPPRFPSIYLPSTLVAMSLRPTYHHRRLRICTRSTSCTLCLSRSILPRSTSNLNSTPTHAMDVTSQGVFRHFVAERRGGSYCFGHNVLLLEVLKGLGYHVYSGGAELEDLLPPLQTMTRCAHMILFVQIPGDSSGATYVADVGLGVSGLIRPILLSDDRDNVAKGATPSEVHRLRRIPTPEGHEDDTAHQSSNTSLSNLAAPIPQHHAGNPPPSSPSKNTSSSNSSAPLGSSPRAPASASIGRWFASATSSSTPPQARKSTSPHGRSVLRSLKSCR